MIPKFEIVDAYMPGNGQLNIKTVVVDDNRFLGHIFHFKNINFDFEYDGIGVSYDLDVDIHKNFLPTTISEEHSKIIQEVAKSILEKIMTDFVDTNNSSTLDNPA